jgi:hypothetical protein
MAKPIKNTPVLKGQDAINFFFHLESNRNKKVDREVYASIIKNAQLLKSIRKVN